MIPEALQHIDFNDLTPEQKNALKAKLQERKRQLQDAMRAIDEALQRCG